MPVLKKDYECAYIYGLVDPRNSLIRYIGWTINPKARLRNHLSLSQLKSNNHKNNWIKCLLKLNIKPYLIVLEITNVDKKYDAERKWIKFIGRKNLTNSTDGGEGLLGYEYSEERNKKVSNSKMGYKATKEHRQNISISKKGVKRKPFSKNTKLKLALVKQGEKRILNPVSKYVGVSRSYKKWISRITFQKNLIIIGSYYTEVEAALAYNDKAIELYGDNSKINIISLEEINAILSEKNVKRKLSKYRGVSLDKRNNKWSARITVNSKTYNLGYYFNEIDAAIAYNKKAIELYGDKAILNNINSDKDGGK